MRAAFALALLLAACAASAQEVYRQVDEQGNVVFTDDPSGAAEPVEVRPNVVETAPAPPPASSPRARAAEQDGRYRRAAIVAPPDDTTLRDPGTVNVVLELEPPLAVQRGDVAVLYVNGEERERGRATRWTLSDLDRGNYALQAEVRSPAGEPLIRSDPVELHVKQTSRRQPSGPSLPGGASGGTGAPSFGGFGGNR